MSRRRRRQEDDLVDSIAKLIVLLSLIAYAPLVAWWNELSPTIRILIVAATVKEFC